jgi:hypothetical protein
MGTLVQNLSFATQCNAQREAPGPASGVGQGEEDIIPCGNGGGFKIARAAP